jgi:hypothetical protein
MNDSAFDNPLFPVPDCGVKVFTYAVPGLAMKLYGMYAVMSTASTYVLQPFVALVFAVPFAFVHAGSFKLFHATSVVDWKPLVAAPITNNVKHGFVFPEGVLGQFGTVDCGGPAGSAEGEMFVIVAPVLY